MKKGSGMGPSMRISRSILRSHAVCWTAAVAAMYSASHVERDIARDLFSVYDVRAVVSIRICVKERYVVDRLWCGYAGTQLVVGCS